MPEEGRGAGALARLFRRVAKAATEDQAETRTRQRRKRGETVGQFRQLMRRIVRRFALRPHFRRAAAKAGRRPAPNNPLPEALFTASPWCDPLNGMDFYGNDLTGFSDPETEIDPGIDPVFPEGPF